MKKGKKIAIAIVVLILIVLGIFGFMIVKDLKQEEKLTDELNSLFGMLENYPLNYDEIEPKLAKTITTGSYYEVETSVKSYVSDFVGNMKELDKLFNNETLVNALSATNIKKDGQDFTKTKKELNNANKSLDTIYKNLSNSFAEEKAMSYINDKNLDEYYTNLYKKYVLSSDDVSSSLEETGKEIISSLDQFKNLIAKEQEIIDFLVKNKRSWKLENDTLVFYSNTLSNKYNKLTSELNNL